MPTPHNKAKFTRDNINKIFELISHHVPYVKACVASGVSIRSFYHWIEMGLKDMNSGIESDYVDFLVRLRKLEAAKIKEYTTRIVDSENGHKGIQFLLERVFWKHFSGNVSEIDLNDRLEALERRKSSEDD